MLGVHQEAFDLVVVVALVFVAWRLVVSVVDEVLLGLVCLCYIPFLV